MCTQENCPWIMPPPRMLKNCRRRWIDVPCLTHSTGIDTHVAKTQKRHSSMKLESPDRTKREPNESQYDRFTLPDIPRYTVSGFQLSMRTPKKEQVSPKWSQDETKKNQDEAKCSQDGSAWCQDEAKTKPRRPPKMSKHISRAGT